MPQSHSVIIMQGWGFCVDMKGLCEIILVHKCMLFLCIVNLRNFLSFAVLDNETKQRRDRYLYWMLPSLKLSWNDSFWYFT